MTVHGSRLTVERVDTLSRRPSSVFVTGTLEGAPLRIGDDVVIHDSSASGTRTVIKSIEMHSAPGRTTIVLDAAVAQLVRSGVVISRPE